MTAEITRATLLPDSGGGSINGMAIPIDQGPSMRGAKYGRTSQRAQEKETPSNVPGRDLRELPDHRDCRARKCCEAARDNLADVPALRPSNHLPQDRYSHLGGEELAVTAKPDGCEAAHCDSV